MTTRLSTPQMIDAVRRHSEHLAAAARGHFTEPVSACPGWTVADLVDHITDVQWSWGTVVADRLSSPVPRADARRPPTRLGEEQALDQLAGITGRLVAALDGGAVHQAIPVWTWAPQAQTIGFVTRHQVQEAAVHDFDASAAAGVGWSIDPEVAADSIEEFLTYSISTPADPAPPETPRLAVPITLTVRDTSDRWSITDGEQPGTLEVSTGEMPGALVVEATASQLLLWLYGRTELPAPALPTEVLTRFRALVMTD